jgi:hypothetical protein
MALWQALGNAIFTGERTWAWRRRMVFAGCAVFLAGVVHSSWFDPDLAHATMVMTNCATGFGATLGIYVGLAVTDDHLKRETERKAGQLT